MAIQGTNTSPTVQIGTQASRPVAPDEDGFVYISETMISVWNQTAGVYRESPLTNIASGTLTYAGAAVVQAVAAVNGVHMSATSKVFGTVKAPANCANTVLHELTAGVDQFTATARAADGTDNSAVDTSTLQWVAIL